MRDSWTKGPAQVIGMRAGGAVYYPPGIACNQLTCR